MDEFKARITAELDTTKLNQQLKQLENGEHKLKVDTDTEDAQKGVQNVNKQIQTSQKTAASFGSTLKSALNIGSAAAVTAKGIQLIGDASKSAVKSIEEIDKAIVNLQMATGESRSAVMGMINDYNKMAQQMGATTTQVADAADAWLRQGHSISDTNTLIKDSMMLSKVAGIDAADSTQYLTSAMKGYKVAAEDVAGIVDKLTAVDLVSATDAGGLAEAMSRVAVTADSAGISMDRLLGYLATTGEVTQRSMSSIGEAYKTIFTRMSDIKSGKLKLIDEDGTTETLSDVELMLSNVGIDLRKTVTEYNNYQDVLDNLATKWDSLSQLQQNALSKAFAGTRQAEYFRVLMENYDSAKKYADVAANSAGSAEQKFGAYLDSLEAKTNTLKAAFESLAMNNISTGLVGGIMDAATAVVQFTDDTHILQGVLTGLAVCGAIKGFTTIATGAVQAASAMQDFGVAMELVSAISVGTNELEQLTSIAGNLSKSQLKVVVAAESLTNAQRIAILTSAGMSEAEASAALASMGLAAAEGTAAGATVTLAGAFKGLMATLAANPFIAIVLGITAATAAMSLLGKEYEHAAEAASNAQSAYDDTVKKLDSVNNELQTTHERIKELQALQANGAITLTEEAELEQLQRQNEELERQKKLLETNAKAQQRSASNAALEALNVQGSQSLYAKENNLEAVGYTSVIDAAREDIAHLQDLYRTRSDLNQQLDEALSHNDVAAISSIQSQISKNEDEITRYTESISGTMTELQGYRDTLADDTELGKLVGGEEMLSALDHIIARYNHLGEVQGEAEEALSAINTFFDGSSGKKALADTLLAMVKNGENATDAIGKLGLTLSDLGLQDSQANYLNQYFKELADSATDAAEAVEKVDGTMSGIKAAKDSENAGSDYVTFSKYLKEAKELFDSGLVGTDEFKTTAELISKGIDSSAESFKKNYEKLSRYFTSDKEGNLTRSGVDRFVSDLSSALDDAGGSFKNTAEAADKLGISTEAFEIILGRLGDYDLSKLDKSVQNLYKNIPRSAQSLSEAKDELSQLKSLYDSLGSGSSDKDYLSKRLAEWEKQINTAETDLSSLDTDIILQMKIAYNLADLQNQVDQARAAAQAGGGREAYATSIALQKTYNTEAKHAVGWDREGAKIPVEFVAAENAYAKIEAQLNEAAKQGNSELIQQLQPQVDAVGQTIDKIVTQFQQAHPEITYETNVDKANAVLNDWLSNENGKQVIMDIIAEDQTGTVIDALNSLGIDPKTLIIAADDQTIDGTKSAKENIESVPEETNTKITAEDSTTDTVNDIIASLTGFDKDYVATLTAEDNASQYLISILAQLTQIPEQELININANDGASGIIAYLQNNLNELPEEVKTKLTAQDATSEKAKKAASEVDKVPKKKNTTLSASGNAVEQAKAATNAINNIPKSKTSTITIVTNKLTNVVNTVRNVVSNISDNVTPKKAKKFNGTAHAQGTVRVSGNWGIAKDEDALVNELGNEIILRDGKPFTVNNGYPAITKLKRGDIIFNHEQTKELLEKGYVTGSHAKVVGSFAGGSLPKVAYASGTSSSSSKNEIDWFEILLNRAEAILKKYTTKLENSFDTLSNRLKAANDAAYAAKQEYSKQQSAYNGYLAAASKIKLSDSLKKKIQSGANYIYDGYKDSEKELIDQYKDLWEKAQACAQAMEELKESIADLYKQAFDLISERYDNEFTSLSNREALISNNIDLAEAKGYAANKTDYESLIQYMEREIAKGKSEYADLTAKLDTAVKSGYVKKFSDEWWQMYNEILEVSGAIQEAEISLAEYQQAINELEWDNFDYIQDRISQITQETDFLIGLLEDKDLFDDNGNLTANGAATITLHNTAYDTYMKQAQDYADAIEELNQQIASDPSNQNLIERREDLLKLQQESIESARDEKDAIKDLIQDGNDALVESMNDRIEVYEDALDAAKDLYDYQKKVADSTKEIASLEKRLNAYQGNDSEEARAKIQSIKVELEEAKANLEETQMEHQISEQKKMLSQMSEDFEDVLNARMDNIDAYLSELLASVEDGGSIPAAIKSAAGEVGYAISDSLSEMIRFGDVTDVLNDISDNLNELLKNYDPIALNSNNDPIIQSDGTVQKVNKPVVKSKLVGGYASGGFVSDIKKAVIANGDDLVTVNTLKVGEAVLTPEQTSVFKEFVASMPSMYDLSGAQGYLSHIISGGVTNESETNITNHFTIHNNIDHVDSYADILAEMQNDRKFEKMVQAMTFGQLGENANRYKKFNYRWK